MAGSASILPLQSALLSLHYTALHCTFSGLLRPTHLFRTHMAAAAVSITVRDQILPRSSALTAIMITQPASQCGWLGSARAKVPLFSSFSRTTYMYRGDCHAGSLLSFKPLPAGVCCRVQTEYGTA